MKKRIISLLMVLVMAFSLSAVTYAEVPTAGIEKPEFEEPGITPQYQYAKECSATLSISGGTAYCSAKANGSSVTKVQITMTLQKKTLLWWSDKSEWTTTVNSSTALFEKTASAGSGTYRVKAVCKVYSGSASESITVYSAEKKV